MIDNMKYIIYKSSRLPQSVSYSGPTWDIAGIRDLYQPQYDNYDTANTLAKKLTQFNGVGFEVAILSDSSGLDDIIDNKSKIT